VPLMLMQHHECSMQGMHAAPDPGGWRGRSWPRARRSSRRRPCGATSPPAGRAAGRAAARGRRTWRRRCWARCTASCARRRPRRGRCSAPPARWRPPRRPASRRAARPACDAAPPSIPEGVAACSIYVGCVRCLRTPMMLRLHAEWSPASGFPDKHPGSRQCKPACEGALQASQLG